MTKQKRKIPLHRLVLMIGILILYCFLPLVVSWQWDWWEGWAYAIITLGSIVIGRGLLALHNPDLFIERASYTKQEGAKSWDRILSPLVAFGSCLIAFVAGLDVRFGWTPALSLPVVVIALVIMLAGFVLANYAFIENRFFSGIVRIQADRGHVLSQPVRSAGSGTLVIPGHCWHSLQSRSSWVQCGRSFRQLLLRLFLLSAPPSKTKPCMRSWRGIVSMRSMSAIGWRREYGDDKPRPKAGEGII